MAITDRNPNTILLSGDFDDHKIIGHLSAGVAITPGMLIERYSNSGVLQWRPNASATEIQEMCIALDQTEFNKGVDDAYAVSDAVKAWPLNVGDEAWMIIPSGQNIAVAGLLQSNGDGKLKAATATTQAAGLGRFKNVGAASGAVTADTRIRVARIQ